MPEISQYIEAYRRRARRAEALRQKRVEQAHGIAQHCAEKLVREFGAERVYLFGSLAEDCFRLDSDIDLAVAGLPPRIFFQASAQISRLAGDVKVDVIPWESYKYQAEVLEKGKLLYEAK
jgi:predicted nucleotidyltransferase